MTEVLVATTAFIVVMGAIFMGFLTYNSSYAMAKDYNMARLVLSDYINMDLRRSTDFFPTLTNNNTHGGWVTNDWTLPMALTIPDYNQSSGTPNQPVRVSLSATELAAAQDLAIARGKLAPPTWTITYGSTTTPRLVVYEQSGQKIIRREGYGTVARPTANTISWTWSGGTPLPVEVAQGVIEIRGIHQVIQDLTPEDLSEQPPEDVITAFKGNYSIRYVPSARSKVSTPANSIISNNVLLRTQYYGL